MSPERAALIVRAVEACDQAFMLRLALELRRSERIEVLEEAEALIAQAEHVRDRARILAARWEG